MCGPASLATWVSKQTGSLSWIELSIVCDIRNWVSWIPPCLFSFVVPFFFIIHIMKFGGIMWRSAQFYLSSKWFINILITFHQWVIWNQNRRIVTILKMRLWMFGFFSPSFRIGPTATPSCKNRFHSHLWNSCFFGGLWLINCTLHGMFRVNS